MKIKLIRHVTNAAVYVVILRRDLFLLDRCVIDAAGNERRGFSTTPNRDAAAAAAFYFTFLEESGLFCERWWSKQVNRIIMSVSSGRNCLFFDGEGKKKKMMVSPWICREINLDKDSRVLLSSLTL